MWSRVRQGGNLAPVLLHTVQNYRPIMGYERIESQCHLNDGTLLLPPGGAVEVSECYGIKF